MSVTAYPLAWPGGWPRTPAHRRQDSKYRFRRNGRFWTFNDARVALADELDRLGAGNVVLSSNYDLRLDGNPRASGSIPADTGIAVYFRLRDRSMVMACDMHVRAEENMRSIALAVEAMRQLERHGGAVMMEKAFAGFSALPPPRSCWEVLGIAPKSDRDAIAAAYREKAKRAHPDAGGNSAAMASLNAARTAALAEIGG